jgi:hypothetical protein
MIKAIETRYAGCRFRSRLEARWAVFFDALKIGWEYEPEGFELPSGRYLPDFRLPDAGAWVEIKGQKPTKRELRLLIELGHAVSETGDKVRMIPGDVPRKVTGMKIRQELVIGIPVLTAMPQYAIVPPSTDPTHTLGPSRDLVADIERCHGIPVDHWDAVQSLWLPGGEPPSLTGPTLDAANAEAQRINDALMAARSARFEHGESGTPRP